jgi:glycerophosphoryl diester phosphodiesterase
VRWIGHGGLAGTRPGGAPTRATLDQAVGLGLDLLELDVCITADGVLALRHDGALPSGRPVTAVPLTELRATDPELLTLDDAVEHLAGRVAVLLDVKGTAAVAPLAGWLAERSPGPGFAVCTDGRAALLHFRDRVPEVARWRTLPEVGEGRDSRRRRIVAGLLRRWLPPRVRPLAAEVGAVALSVDHWVLTASLCRAAHDADLSVAAWTVNRPEHARRAHRCGADLITTDRVVEMRAAITDLGA